MKGLGGRKKMKFVLREIVQLGALMENRVGRNCEGRFDLTVE